LPLPFPRPPVVHVFGGRGDGYRKRDQVDGLSITHNGHAVERLTRSRIRLWNAGRKAIEPADVVSTNPLRVQYPGPTLLDLKLVHSTDDAIKLRPRPDGDGWMIEFEYWEGKNGVVLEALHTSTRVVPKLTSSVRGLRPIKRLGRIDDGAFVSPDGVLSLLCGQEVSRQNVRTARKIAGIWREWLEWGIGAVFFAVCRTGAASVGRFSSSASNARAARGRTKRRAAV